MFKIFDRFRKKEMKLPETLEEIVTDQVEKLLNNYNFLFERYDDSKFGKFTVGCYRCDVKIGYEVLASLETNDGRIFNFSHFISKKILLLRLDLRDPNPPTDMELMSDEPEVLAHPPKAYWRGYISSTVAEDIQKQAQGALNIIHSGE